MIRNPLMKNLLLPKRLRKTGGVKNSGKERCDSEAVVFQCP